MEPLDIASRLYLDCSAWGPLFYHVFALQSANPTIPDVHLRPEILDAISAVQTAHRSILKLPDILQAQDPALLEDFGFRERINDQLAALVSLRSDLLRLLCDLAECDW